MSIFDFNDYRKFVLKLIHEQPKRGRGMRSELARIMKCKTSYVTRILDGNAELSLEQAFELRDFLNLSEDEIQYFLLLVMHGRAGTEALKKNLKKQIVETQHRMLQMKRHTDIPADVLTQEQQFKYFSSWEYSMVHLLLTIPAFQTLEAIYQKIKLPKPRIRAVLDYLEKNGFAKKEQDGRYKIGPQRIFLPADALMISTHHTHWRLHAIQACQNRFEEDFHYSSVISVSKNDYLRIKQTMVKAVEECKKIIKDSPSEIPCGFHLDVYEVN